MTDPGSTGVLICPDCGTRNALGTDFCVNCGGYLAWDRTSLIPVITAPAPPSPVVEPPKTQAADVAPAALHAPEALPPVTPHATVTPAPPPGAVISTPTARVTTPDPPLSSPKADLSPSEVLPPTMVLPVAVPPRVPKPARTESELVQPAAPIPKPASTLPPAMAEVAAPGDILCANCGLPNSPSRHFCSRCGAALVAPTTGAAGRTQPIAGTRPLSRRRRFPIALVIIVVLLLVAGVVGYIERAPLRTEVGTVLDRVAPQKPANPASSSASSSAAGHGAALAFDGLSNTAWEPQRVGTGVGQSLVANFAKPFRLVYVQIRPGAAETQHTFLAAGRPSTMLLTMTLENGSTATEQLSLADDPSDQQFLVGQDGVTKVQLTVESSQGTSATAPLAITEVEFRTR